MFYALHIARAKLIIALHRVGVTKWTCQDCQVITPAARSQPGKRENYWLLGLATEINSAWQISSFRENIQDKSAPD